MTVAEMAAIAAMLHGHTGGPQSNMPGVDHGIMGNH